MSEPALFFRTQKKLNLDRQATICRSHTFLFFHHLYECPAEKKEWVHTQNVKL